MDQESIDSFIVGHLVLPSRQVIEAFIELRHQEMAKSHRSLRVRAKALFFNSLMTSSFLKTTTFNLLPLLRGNISAFPPEHQIKGVPSSLLRRLYRLLVVRGVLHNNQARLRQARKLAAELHERVAAANPVRTAEPVPVVHFDDLVEDDFRRDYYLRYHPVVIKGLPLNVDHWNLDWFVEQFGDCEVILTEVDTGKNFVGPLSLLKTRTPPPYLHNCAQIFQQNGHLLDDLKVDQLSGLIREQMAFMPQVFFGKTIGSGTHFHCASNNNFFFQIRGQKRWTFVDTNYSFLMYPYLTQTNGYQTCVVSGLSRDADDDKLPLFKYCPRIQVILEPGDVLFSPSWWWHAVENLTPETVGVATRWSLPDKKLTNRLYAMLADNTPQAFSLRQKIIEHALGSGVGGTAIFKRDYDLESAHPVEVHSHDTSFEDIQAGKGLLAWFDEDGQTP